MNTFFVADTHFGHYNIIKHCNRPWDAEEHDDRLVEHWNSVVSGKDTVYHLGDFAMFKAVEGGEHRMKAYRKLRMRLKGKIHLVLGNHDKMSQELYSCFSKVYEGIKDLKIDGQKVTLCHYPMRSWNCSVHGAWHFFGHVHGRLENANIGLSCDVGVDVPGWNYTPVSWELLKEKMKPKMVSWNARYNETSRE